MDETPSFSAMVVTHQARVFGVAYAVLGDRARAEEVAQEAFLLAWVKLRAEDHVEDRAAWICGIARNLARNAQRRGGREVGGIAVDAADAAPSAIENMVETERLESVHRAIEGLDESYREPLVLFYVDGESIKGVAEALELPETVVRKRLDRGRDQIRAELAEVETRLRGVRPGAAFTAAVVAAWSRNASAAVAGGSMWMIAAGIAALAAVAVGVVAPAMRGSGVPGPTNHVVGSGGTRAKRASSASASPPAAGVPGLPGGMQRRLDLELNQVPAQDMLRILAAATEVPIAVDGKLDALVNVKDHDVLAIDILDEICKQAGGVRSEASVLSVEKGAVIGGLPIGQAVTLELDGAPLGDVVSVLAQALGEPVYVSADLMKTPVKVRFDKIPAGKAMEEVLRDARLGIVRKQGYVVHEER